MYRVVLACVRKLGMRTECLEEWLRLILTRLSLTSLHRMECLVVSRVMSLVGSALKCFAEVPILLLHSDHPGIFVISTQMPLQCRAQAVHDRISIS